MSAPEDEVERSTGKTEHVEPKHELSPSAHFTLPADRAMLALDHDNGQATISFYCTHVIPQVRDKGPWGMKEFIHEIVAEIKIPIAAMNVLAAYHIWVMSNGLDVLKAAGEHLVKHPTEFRGVSYGPTGFSVERKKPEGSAG